jgi:tRNA threonylcarbamoyladenosine biosynthesis protein TsaB
MNILALDTATEACSVAILTDADVITRFELAPRRHAELILPMLEEVIAAAGIHVTQLDAVAFGRGPGSFTGVRLAVSIAQGIAFAADLPVVPVSTLAAMAAEVLQQNRGADYAAIALDARMGEVYWGLYQPDELAGVNAITDECVCAAAQVPVAGMAGNGNGYGAGSGWHKYADMLMTALPVLSFQAESYPSAGNIARLAAIALSQGQAVPAEQALPVYLRDRVTT